MPSQPTHEHQARAVLLGALTAALAATAAGQIYYLRNADETARRSADAALKGAIAAERSAELARDTLIASNRAWLKVQIVLGDQPLIYSAEVIDCGFALFARNFGK